jgi:hypothetical protein
MISLDSNWKFSDVQDNIEAIKTQYEEVLSSFFTYEMKEKRMATHFMKRQVFDYENILYWQRERLWEVLNGDFGIEEFRRLCR